MNLRLKIALRNVLRNGRRTTLNVLMIAGGIAAIVVFQGFAHNLITKLETVAINTQYGHLQFANQKAWEPSVNDAVKDRVMRPSPELLKAIKDRPQVAYTSGRTSFYGLLSVGEHSLSAKGIGFDPQVETQLRDQLKIIAGRNLSNEGKFELILGSGLQKQLGIPVGTSMTLLTYTYDGAVNAIDAEFVGVFQSTLTEVDDSTFFLPLVTAQKLLDTDSIEKLVVQLKSNDDTQAVKADLASVIPPGLQLKSWDELAVYYRQVVDYFSVQNMVIQWILMLLALLAIANTIGMSISERTGEIGTIRAIGDKRSEIVLQFVIEGLILGLLGGIVGCILGLGLSQLVTALKIPINTPGASIPLAVEVDTLFSAYWKGFVLTCLMSVLATLAPAIKASRVPIVDSLRRNI